VSHAGLSRPAKLRNCIGQTDGLARCRAGELRDSIGVRGGTSVVHRPACGESRQQCHAVAGSF
jgi:hypothetical protein